jgi:hypothetical protein
MIRASSIFFIVGLVFLLTLTSEAAEDGQNTPQESARTLRKGTEQPVPFSQRGWGSKTLLVTGAALCSVGYTPVKAFYAVGGTFTGGLVYVMSAGQSKTAANEIVEHATYGDWYIHPDHLTKVRPLEFKGSAPKPTSKKSVNYSTRAR